MVKRSASDTGWYWLAGAGAFLAGFVALVVLVNGDRLGALNEFSKALVHQPGPRLLQSAMETASFWGGRPGQIAVVLMGSLVLWPQRRGWALSLPLVMTGAGVLQLTAKWAVDRPRPNLDPWGFPSAHVLSLVVLLGCIAYLLGTSRLHRGWRLLGAVSCAAVVLVVGYSRMYLDAAERRGDLDPRAVLLQGFGRFARHDYGETTREKRHLVSHPVGPGDRDALGAVEHRALVRR